MSIHETMKELAQYLRMQEEIAETVEGLKDQIKAYMKENGLETLASDDSIKAIKQAIRDMKEEIRAIPAWEHCKRLGIEV